VERVGIIAGRLCLRSGAGMGVRVGGGVRLMRGMRAEWVGVAEGMVAAEAGAGVADAREGAGAEVVGWRAGMAGAGVEVVAGGVGVAEMAVAVGVAGVGVGEVVAVEVGVAGVGAGVGVREFALVVRSHWDTPLAGLCSCIQPGAGFSRRVEGQLLSSKTCWQDTPARRV
jgi:hypothetical protein